MVEQASAQTEYTETSKEKPGNYKKGMLGFKDDWQRNQDESSARFSVLDVPATGSKYFTMIPLSVPYLRPLLTKLAHTGTEHQQTRIPWQKVTYLLFCMQFFRVFLCIQQCISLCAVVAPVKDNKKRRKFVQNKTQKFSGQFFTLHCHRIALPLRGNLAGKPNRLLKVS